MQDNRFQMDASDLEEIWDDLDEENKIQSFRRLTREDAADFFLDISAKDKSFLIRNLSAGEQKLWLRMLAPDDAADVVQELPVEMKQEILTLLDEATKREVVALLAYQEDEAGGLMNPRFARLRPDMTVDQALSYLRRQTRAHLETIYYSYVLDPSQVLVGVVSFRELFASPNDKQVSDVMRREFVFVTENTDQETVASLISENDLAAIPVVDAEGKMKGIVTVDDIVDVVQEEATEDFQKIGGMEALDTSYLETGFFSLIKKRAGWLAALFVGEMLTASAMSQYEHEVAKAVVLALFVPLIISSGGNSGSQASTLVIRAMALGEVRMKDWWRIFRRECGSGLILGLILATLGFARVVIWQHLFHSYGDHYVGIALTVAASLVGIVMWGTLIGSMLPLGLNMAGFDPASASAPFVATLVDVVGLVLYFSFAQLILSGTLL